MILFDFRLSNSRRRIAALANMALKASPDKAYLNQFGPVFSRKWTGCFERGEIPVEVFSGTVSHVGERLDFVGEQEDVIEFICQGEPIAYERSDFLWAGQPISIGDKITLTRTEVVIPTETGPIIYGVDLLLDWIS